MSWNTSVVSPRPRVVAWIALVVLFAIPGSLDFVFTAQSPRGPAGQEDGSDERLVGKLDALGLAAAEKDWAPDEDSDGFPDEMESVFGSNVFESDTDFDGFGDALEFTLGSSSLDGNSKPELRPATRAHVREVGGRLRVFVGIYPANPHLVDAFEVHLGSPEIEIGYGDHEYRVFNFTTALPAAIESFSTVTERGLSVLTFTFELPSEMLDTYAPLTLGIAARLANTVTLHETDLMILPDGTRAVSTLLDKELSGPGFAPYGLLPLNAQYGGGGEPEYCELTVDYGVPVGVAGISYTIEIADCEPAGLTICVQEECETMVGREILEIDRGFLQDRMD